MPPGSSKLAGLPFRDDETNRSGRVSFPFAYFGRVSAGLGEGHSRNSSWRSALAVSRRYRGASKSRCDRIRTNSSPRIAILNGSCMAGGENVGPLDLFHPRLPNPGEMIQTIAVESQPRQAPAILEKADVLSAKAKVSRFHGFG